MLLNNPVIALSLRPSTRKWKTLRFSSTLYLRPILELLLQGIPTQLYSELHLGLQEALVNAAKHGNSMDVRKSIQVKYLKHQNSYTWVIVDEGTGFSPPTVCHILSEEPNDIPDCSQECGRGIYILYQVFDEVTWSGDGTQLQLKKLMA